MINAKRLLVCLVIFLVNACRDETIMVSPAKAPAKVLTFLEITPSDSTIYAPAQLKATGRFDDSSEADLTDNVNWRVSNNAVADVNASGTVEPYTTGNISVVASKDGVQSRAVTLTIVDSAVCGHIIGNAFSTAVGDADPSNAAGACIKLIQDSSGNWFTSAPSADAAAYLGFQPLTSNHYESGVSGPTGFFMRFTWGEIDLWCQRLNTLGFAGRSDWTMPSQTQLSGLFSELGNLFTGYGWPVYAYYFSSTSGGAGTFVDVSLRDGSTNTPYPNFPAYGSCVSTSTSS